MSGVQFQISNQAGKPVYVYDFNYGAPASVQPVSGGDPLPAGGNLNLSLQASGSMRIYFSDARLSESLEAGKAPDAFNYTVDGSIMYSFAEYKYEPASSRYTVDLSYIDAYSYPVTLKFTNVGSYAGAEEGFEYGPQSLSAMKSALEGLTDYAWGALVWPLTNVKTQWNQFPDGIQRIIGPNKAWQGQTGGPTDIGPWVPTTYEAFYQSLPKDGTQLFSSSENFAGWLALPTTPGSKPTPSNTGYTEALHLAATTDSSGKYGFFCYPKDNPAGEFTFVPDTVACQVTVYPYSS